MECGFCSEFNSPRGPDSRILWEDDEFVLLPTVGCLRPGYCLLMPRDHFLSFAALPQEELCRAFALAESMRHLIGEKYGDTIIAEHGPGACNNRGASCCDHAHLHLIPIPGHITDVCILYVATGGPPHILSDLSELQKLSGQAYLLLSPKAGTYWIWTNTQDFQQQFARRVCARVMGIEDQYDWRRFHFAENMRITQEQLKPAIPPAASQDTGLIL